MTTPKSAFDDSQPTFNTVTLPVIIDTEYEDLTSVMERTMEHFGLLYYQVFLKDLEAHWPAELKSLTVTNDGEGYLVLGMTERPAKPWQTEYDHDALAAFRRRMAEAHGDRPAHFYHLVAKGFQQGRRRVERQELPGLFQVALEGAQLARVQGALLDRTLPETNTASPSKPKL